MAMRLTKAERDQIKGEEQILRDAWSTLEDATDEANQKIRDVLEELAAAQSAYDGKVQDARSLMEEIFSSLRGDYDDKSERWQDSERGVEFDEWITNLETMAQDLEAYETEDIEWEDITMPDNPADRIEEEPLDAPET